MINLVELSVRDFIDVTASDAPAPGGGSVSALVGGLSAALAEMVANLTVGREKYAEAEEKMQELLTVVPAIRQKLLLAVDADSKAFDSYMAALAMPKSSEKEKTARSLAMQLGLKEAASVPLSVAQESVKLFPFLKAVLCSGNPNAVTDAMVGVMLARTCAMGAIYNVRVNLLSIVDEEFTVQMSAQCDQLQALALREEAEALQEIEISHFAH